MKASQSPAARRHPGTYAFNRAARWVLLAETIAAWVLFGLAASEWTEVFAVLLVSLGAALHWLACWRIYQAPSLRRSEIPGAFWITLAGPASRRRFRAILAARDLRKANAGKPATGGFRFRGHGVIVSGDRVTIADPEHRDCPQCHEQRRLARDS